MIQLDQVSKHYKTKQAPFRALNGVSLQIERGEIFGIIGRSAAGKSTLLRLMNSLEQPSGGRVSVDKKYLDALDHSELRQLRQRFGVVFQHFNLLASRTVYENVRLPLRVSGVLDRRDQARRVEQVLARVGLADQLHKYPAALSGGQRQRVGIARALVNQPDVLLCDEATSALDPETTQSILQLLLEIHRESRITIVLVTHSMSVIRSLADRVAILDHGQLVELGPVAEVFLRPQHAVTRSLLIESGFEAERPAALAEGIVAPVLALSYHGPVGHQPLIAQIARESGLDFVLLQGSVGRLRETPYGQFTVQLPPGSESRLPLFQSLCERLGVRCERVH